MNLEKIKEKIAKLTQLCRDPAASQGEIDNAIRLAKKMMAKFNIDESDLNFDHLDPNKKTNLGRYMVTCLHDKQLRWEGQVAQFVCKFVGMVGCYSAEGLSIDKGKETPIDIIFFYGTKSSVNIACDMYKQLRRDIADKAKSLYKSYSKIDGRSYCTGYVIGLYDSLDRQTKMLLEDKETHGLMIQSQELTVKIKEQSHEWLAAQFNVHLGKSRKVSVKRNAEAQAKGIAHGKVHKLNDRLG